MDRVTRLDDWDILIDFLPKTWLELAHETGALKGLRKDKSPEALLRTMFIHCACGYSLRETAVRAREANLADMSDVALMKRLKKCQEWFRQMCICLFKERGIQTNNSHALNLRIFDATHVEEPGQTGSQWRVHYSMSLPDLHCDYFAIGPTKGKGTGESLSQFPINPGDFILADRGYCRGPGLGHIANNKAYVTLRLHPAAVSLFHSDGKQFDCIHEFTAIKESGEIREWPVAVKTVESERIYGRLCVMRKDDIGASRSERRSIRKASKNYAKIKPETLFHARYFTIFTTFPEKYSVADILSFYRLRWQIELVFKRFKQIANFGHLPKYDDDSSKAWLYGKLLIALLIEKLIAYGSAISPWRANYTSKETPAKYLERICFCIPPCNRNSVAVPVHN
jgi:hypothetical protein